MTSNQPSLCDRAKLDAVDGIIRDIRNLDKSIDVKALEDYSYNLECKIQRDFEPTYDIRTYYRSPVGNMDKGMMLAIHKDGRTSSIPYEYGVGADQRHFDAINKWMGEHQPGKWSARRVKGSPFVGRAWKCSQ